MSIYDKHMAMLFAKRICLQVIILINLLHFGSATGSVEAKLFRSACRRDVLMKVVRRGARLIAAPQNVVTEIRAESLPLCVKKCLEAEQCKTINYKAIVSTETELNCQLLNASIRSNNASLSSSIEWTHYEPISQVTPRCRWIACNAGFQCIDVCTTSAGYECREIDECASSPCQNNGTCTDDVNKYTCACVAGFTGVHCETNINECGSSPCQNGGSCLDEVNRYTCLCAPGYTGVRCGTDINECSSSPCQNGGSCVDGVNQYSCTCAAGYTGTQCETNINECSSSPCQNGGTCADGINQYSCTCAAGYAGSQCERKASESCRSLYLQGYRSDTTYTLTGESGAAFRAYCHMTDGGWTLIARFSNADAKNWVDSGAAFWYDQLDSGYSASVTFNGDMINRAFHDIKGRDIKLSRSDDAGHKFLLYAGGCLPTASTFRAMISSYGNFRSNARWLPTNDGCRGSCTIHYYGSVSGVAGFSQYACSSDLQSSSKLGFWCHYGSGDGAVLMIGGGGSACSRADHGIGVTEADYPMFGSLSDGQDFGNEGLGTAVTAYALNLWIR